MHAYYPNPSFCINIQLVKCLTLYHDWVPSQQRKKERLVSAEPMYCGSIVCIIFLCEWGGKKQGNKLLRTDVANKKNVLHLFLPSALITLTYCTTSQWHYMLGLFSSGMSFWEIRTCRLATAHSSGQKLYCMGNKICWPKHLPGRLLSSSETKVFKQ